MKEFRASFKLSDINEQFLKDYRAFLISRKNKGTTIWTSFKFVHVIVLKALRENIIEDSPFRIFKMPVYRDPLKSFLTKKQVQTIEN